MRSIKSTGGMTRDRGMSESQRAAWLLSMPTCADINTSIQNITGLSFSSEQHKDISIARKRQDGHDMMVILALLEERDPFIAGPVLKNTATGMVANTKVDAHKANLVGNKILKKMEGHKATEYTFRSEQAVKMASINTVKIDAEVVAIEPQLLFQRLVSAAGSKYEDKSEVFRYELSSHPSSLSKSSIFLRQGNKALLADGIWKRVSKPMPESAVLGDVRLFCMERHFSKISLVSWLNLHFHH